MKQTTRRMRDQEAIMEFIYTRHMMDEPINAKEIRGLGYTSFRKGKFAVRGLLKRAKNRAHKDKKWQKKLNERIASLKKQKILEFKERASERAFITTCEEFLEESVRSLSKDHTDNPMAKKKPKSGKASSLPVRFDGKILTPKSHIRKVCPACKKVIATTLKTLKEKFGVRRMKPADKHTVPQSSCITCRHY